VRCRQRSFGSNVGDEPSIFFVGLLCGGAYESETVVGFGDEKAPEVYEIGFGRFRFRMMPG
jgi:hypothetical protein